MRPLFLPLLAFMNVLMKIFNMIDVLEDANPYFHSEHYADEVPHMHYESEENCFVLPSELNTNVFGEANESDTYTFP